jgi:Family of unknown function (DUF6339)
MLEVPLFKEATVKNLFEKIAENLDTYRVGSFDALSSDTSLFLVSACQLDEEKALQVTCTDDDENEVACCLAISGGLKGVTAYLARDERLWTRLTHIEFLEYSRTRWPIPQDDERAISHIRKHFFSRGARGLERDNAISRLWWMTAICSRVEGLPLEGALEAFLHQSDVRANIIERPTTSQNPTVLSAVVNKLHESYHGDRGLYERSKFREVMKRLNIEGGVRLLETLDFPEMKTVFDRICD